MPAKGRRAHLDERVLLFVGTTKGVFVYDSDFDRDKWKRSGPHVAEHAVHSIAFDHRDEKTIYLATDGGLHRTRDFGRSWERAGRGLPSENVSHVTIGHLSEPGAIWVGLAPAAIAKSADGGETFQEISGFRGMPSAKEWWGNPGAPLVSSIVVHSDSPNELHVAASIAGVFRTVDGGQTWVVCNQGVAPTYPPRHEDPSVHRDIQRLVSNPAKPERLYAVAGSGVYRTDDDGDSWKDVSKGLSSRVTRSIVVSQAKPGTIFVVPLRESKDGPPRLDGPLAVYRSIDGGDNWDRLTEGLPERLSGTVHREAMRMDTLEEEGVYVGTSDGHLFVSLDEGETWNQVASGLAPVLSLEVVVQEK